jgi:acetyl-CoA carboxylase biotin carboxyl carrier protein
VRAQRLASHLETCSLAGPQELKAFGVSRTVISPVSGQFLTCLVKVGDRVLADTEVGIIEAMKMHIPVVAEASGRVVKWLVGENSTVAEGQALLELESA